MAKFREEFPERFVNVGVAEQSMIGLCAGLALRGCRPFAYTIATFTIYRPFEQVRDDLCYQNVPATLVGIGGGVTYSTLGGTHHAQEDIAADGGAPEHGHHRPLRPDGGRGRDLGLRRPRRADLPPARKGRRADLSADCPRPLRVRQDPHPQARATTSAFFPTARS